MLTLPYNRKGEMEKRSVWKERFVWGVIYLNIPLWIAVGILAFAFKQWQVAKVIVIADVGLILIAFVLQIWHRNSST